MTTTRIPDGLADVMARVAKGGSDGETAYAEIYDAVSGQVFGVAQRVIRDSAQAEEVAQEVMLEVWRLAPRYDLSLGSVRAWVMTIAHRRSVDRVRSAQSATDRDFRASTSGSLAPETEYDVVADQVGVRLDHERVRHALHALTDLQRESIILAYFGGRTQMEIATELGVPLGTIKTRMRDGLIRLRDALDVDDKEVRA